MASAPGLEAFDPLKNIEQRVAKHSMLLAGSWDLIAKVSKVKALFQASDKKIEGSSVFVDIQRGLHTGFQDTIALFQVPLTTILSFLLNLDFFLTAPTTPYWPA
jgi:hypothetical protein